MFIHSLKFPWLLNQHKKLSLTHLSANWATHWDHLSKYYTETYWLGVGDKPSEWLPWIWSCWLLSGSATQRQALIQPTGRRWCLHNSRWSVHNSSGPYTTTNSNYRATNVCEWQLRLKYKLILNSFRHIQARVGTRYRPLILAEVAFNSARWRVTIARYPFMNYCN